MTDGQDDEAPVAVLGTGIMGSAIARSLLRAGLKTIVWDRSASATAALAEACARPAASPTEAVREARVVITMLPTAEVVRAVMLDGGVVEAFAKRAVWAQMGTIGVSATLDTAARVHRLRPDLLFVDAPVSGSKGPAGRGQLVILASGPVEAENIVKPAFSAVGRKTVWLGEAGQGSRMKLAINAYLAILIEAVAETLELADRFGIDHGKLAEAIEGGPLDAPLAGAKLHSMEIGDFTPEFPLRWALKDVDLALGAAGAEPPPLLAALSPHWRRAVDAGLGDEDISAARRALAH
jgi:3-hydroxyisobutyrate dehydrogenase